MGCQPFRNKEHTDVLHLAKQACNPIWQTWRSRNWLQDSDRPDMPAVLERNISSKKGRNTSRLYRGSLRSTCLLLGLVEGGAIYGKMLALVAVSSVQSPGHAQQGHIGAVLHSQAGHLHQMVKSCSFLCGTGGAFNNDS